MTSTAQTIGGQLDVERFPWWQSLLTCVHRYTRIYANTWGWLEIWRDRFALHDRFDAKWGKNQSRDFNIKSVASDQVEGFFFYTWPRSDLSFNFWWNSTQYFKVREFNWVDGMLILKMLLLSYTPTMSSKVIFNMDINLRQLSRDCILRE